MDTTIKLVIDNAQAAKFKHDGESWGVVRGSCEPGDELELHVLRLGALTNKDVLGEVMTATVLSCRPCSYDPAASEVTFKRVGAGGAAVR